MMWLSELEARRGEFGAWNAANQRAMDEYAAHPRAACADTRWIGEGVMTLKLGSVCTGYGGLDLAVAQVLDVEHAWVADVCKFDKDGNAGHHDPCHAPCSILAHRFPGVPNLGDIKAIDWTTVPSIEVFTAGYPCQPFSHAGRRRGTDDPRHLWPFIREAIRVLQPRLTFLENVDGHRSLGFDRVVGDMAEDGMHVRWVVLPASGVGAPHQRKRLFMLITPDAEGDTGRLEYRDDHAA